MNRTSKQIDLYVPTRYNDGRLIEPVVFDREQRFLCSMFGGVTVFPSCSGLWRSPTGQTQRESIEVWRVIVYEYDEEWWEQYAERACACYDQKEFLVTIVDVVGRTF